MRSKEWGECILLTEHRQALVPILVYCEGELDLLPDMPAAEKCRRQATAHAEIAHAVAAARAICNPYRAAEARRQPVKRRLTPPGVRVAYPAVSLCVQIAMDIAWFEEQGLINLSVRQTALDRRAARRGP